MYSHYVFSGKINAGKLIPPAVQEGLESGVCPKVRTAEEIVTLAKKRALGKTGVKQHG